MIKGQKLNTLVQVLFGTVVISLMVSKSFSSIVMALVVLTALVTAGKGDEKSSWRKLFHHYGLITYLWFLWLAWLLLGYLVNGNLGKKQLNEILDFRWILAVYALAFLIRRVEFHPRFLWGVFLAMAAIYVLDLQMYPDLYNPRYGVELPRISGFFENPNDLAHSNLLFSLIIFSALLNESFEKSSRRRIIFSFFSVLSFFVTFFTYTRSAWFGTAVGALIILMGLYRKRAFASIISGIAVFALVFAFNLGNLKKRTLETFSTHNSTSERLVLWKTHLLIFRENPITGLGYYENVRQIQRYYDRLHVPDTQIKGHAHNQYINFLAGTGIIGFLIYMSIWAWFIYKNVQQVLGHPGKERWLQWGCLGGQIGFLIAGIGECNFEMSISRYVLLVIWSIVLCGTIDKDFKIKIAINS